MIPQLDPKGKFVNSTVSSKFVDLTADDEFQRFIETAFAEMASSQRQWATANDAAVFAYELSGARKFIATLYSLPRPELPLEPPQNKDNLPWSLPSKRRHPLYPHQVPQPSQTPQAK